MKRLISFSICFLLAFSAFADEYDFYVKIEKTSWNVWLSFVITSEEEHTADLADVMNDGDYWGESCFDDVVVPETVNGYTVTSISSDLTWLKSVTVPKTVKEISSFVGGNSPVAIYYDSDLADWCKVKRPGWQTIKNIYVNGTKLAGDLVIPETVKEIENNVFANIKSITSVKIPYALDSFGVGVFYNCSNMTLLEFGDPIREVPGACASGCTNLKQVVLGNNVEVIGGGAFKNCKNLEDITLPPTLKEIGNEAFVNCEGLTSLPVDLAKIQTLGDGVFQGCSFTSVEPNCSIISKDLFKECSSLASVEFGNNVTEIKESAFEYCGKISSITIPKTIKKIGVSAFAKDYGLTSLTIESEGCYIANKAFDECRNLTSVTCKSATPPRMGGSEIFDDAVYSGAKLYVPKGAIGEYEKANVWANFADIVEVDMGGDEPTEYEPEDLNHDGDINTADVTRIYNRIIYGKNNEE